MGWLRTVNIHAKLVITITKMAFAKRQANFSREELDILTEEVTANSEILFGRFSSTVTNKMKSDIWKGITEKVGHVYFLLVY